MYYLFLADGFEEIEALSPLDILRRANIDIKTVGINKKEIIGAHNIPVRADIINSELDFYDIEGIILPGGMPGTVNLEADTQVQKALERCYNNNLLIAAICAAPSILGHKGYLKGKNAICFPGFENDLIDAKISEHSVVKDGNIITAKGAGVALEFGYEILSYIKNEAASTELKNTMCYLK